MGEGHASDQSTGGTTAASQLKTKVRHLKIVCLEGEERGNQTDPLEAQEEPKPDSLLSRICLSNGWEQHGGLLTDAMGYYQQNGKKKKKNRMGQLNGRGWQCINSAETRPSRSERRAHPEFRQNTIYHKHSGLGRVKRV